MTTMTQRCVWWSHNEKDKKSNDTQRKVCIPLRETRPLFLGLLASHREYVLQIRGAKPLGDEDVSCVP